MPAKRLVMVPVLSSAARIPLPLATMARAVCISSVAFIAVILLYGTAGSS